MSLLDAALLSAKHVQITHQQLNAYQFVYDLICFSVAYSITTNSYSFFSKCCRWRKVFTMTLLFWFSVISLYIIRCKKGFIRNFYQYVWQVQRFPQLAQMKCHLHFNKHRAVECLWWHAVCVLLWLIFQPRKSNMWSNVFNAKRRR